MSAPPNQTALTAMVVGGVPFTVTQDVADQPSTLQLWYTYTAGPTDYVLGLVPYADISSGYEPALTIYTGPAASPTIYHVSNSVQRAACVPVTSGTTYLFQVTQHGAASPVGASLTFRLDRAPQQIAPAGSIIAAEENTGFRTPVLSGAADDTIYYYIHDATFMIASIGTTLADGTMIGDDNGDTLHIYSPAITRLWAGLPYLNYTPQFVSSDYAQTFYLAYVNSYPTDPIVLHTLTKDGGTTADTWTLPSNSAGTSSGAPSRDGAIFYYGSSTGAVHRYDLVNETALSDLAAPITGYTVRTDLIVLGDGSILVVYNKPSVPDTFITRYAADGTVLNTYPFTTSWVDHIALAPDDPTSFWAWLHNSQSSPTVATYRRITVSDGTTVSQGQYDMFAGGPQQRSYDPTYSSATSVPLFGPAPTCVFFITRAVTSQNVIDPAGTVEVPIRRLRRSPHLSQEQFRIFYHRFQLDLQPGIGTITGPGVTPTVMLRWSDDGGRTWSNEMQLSAGAQGDYTKRVYALALGSGRDRVFEVSTSDPVNWTLLAAYLDTTTGTN